MRLGLKDNELEIYDLLKKEKMTATEEQKVKLAAKALLKRLLEEQPKVLVQDWHRDTQTRSAVRSAVEEVLDDRLPRTYDRGLFKEKCDNVFDLMLKNADSGQKWAA